MAEQKGTTRRDFIFGNPAADVLGKIASGELEPPPPTEKEGEFSSYLLHMSRQAMACEWSVFLNAEQHSEAEEPALRALDLVDQLEDQLSVFRDESEVSRLNNVAQFRPMIVRHNLFELLSRAVELYEMTAGAFDITAGPITRLWGFLKREGRFPDEDELRETLERVGSRWLELDAEHCSVSFQRNIEINLGAVGKGYALQRCAELMVEQQVDNFLIHGGQSSVVARGSRIGSSGWTIGLKHPLRPEQRLAEIYLRDQALGTSGSATQSFRHQGRRYGHILDPRTGYPAEGVLSATVVSPDATTADALATGFYVLGVEKSLEICDQIDNLGVLFVLEGKRSGSTNIVAHGLSDENWNQLV